MKTLIVLKTSNGFYIPVKPADKGAFTLEEIKRMVPKDVVIKVYAEESEE